MAPFSRRPDADPEADRRAQESLRAIEAGGIPLEAQARLDELRRRGSFFTSDLSVPEFLVAKEAGFHPISQVMGSSFYRVGWQRMPGSLGFGAQAAGGLGPGSWAGYGPGQTVELETQTEAWNEARRLALGRLREEARRAGADAVVGVRLERGRYDWAAGMIEFVATGTAVRSERYELGEEPGLSNLTGQDFAKLFRAGYWPVGLVAGSTVAYVVTGWQQQSRSGGLLGGLRNQELPDFTRGLYDARTRALARVTRQSHELGAHGLVGVEFDRHQHVHERGGNSGFTDLVIEMHVLGTAIVELAPSAEPPSIYTVLALNEEAR